MKLGRPFKYLPNELLNKVEEYKVWAQKQTFSKVIYDQKIGEQRTIELKMPLTVHQFCIFIGIKRQSFYEIMNNEREPNSAESVEINKQLSDIFTCVHDFIQANQISGAILNEYNPTIVARLNGLNETLEVNNTGTAPVLNIQLPINSKLQQLANDANFTPVNNKSLNS
ncbi:MAG: terminase small subunit [Culicoidibacterales bacterium]